MAINGDQRGFPQWQPFFRRKRQQWIAPPRLIALGQKYRVGEPCIACRGQSCGNAFRGKDTVMLLGRSAAMLALATGAVGIPYVVSESGISDKPKAVASLGDDPVLHPVDVGGAVETGQLHLSGGGVTPSPGGTLSGDLGEPFRFEITPDWVLRRWERVSTVSNLPDLQGYRVPLVTGTREFDIAGSLTYFFDHNKKLQRIVFHGQTGNAVPLTQRLTKMYGFRRETTSDPGLYLFRVRWDGKPVSELQLRSSTVVHAGDPHGRIEVHLLLERPAKSELFGNYRGRPLRSGF